MLRELDITHLHFLDDTLFFFNGVVGACIPFGSFWLYYLYSNQCSKLLNYFHDLEDCEIKLIGSIFPYSIKDQEDHFKYLTYHLKPNCYKKSDQDSLLEKLDRFLFSSHFLGYIMHAWIPKSTLEHIQIK